MKWHRMRAHGSWRVSLAVGLVVQITGCATLKVEPQTIDVRACGARGDGATDDTAAFRRGIERAAQRGLSVFVPKGTYVISGPLALERVTLRGPEGGAWPADVDSLPSIHPVHRDAPAFTVLAGGAIRGLDITYAWAKEPTNGPPAILVSGVGAYLSNLRIRHAWDGILADGTNNVGRANFENIFMVSIRNTGVRVTGTWDVPRLNNIEVWNAGPVERPLQHGVGFALGKNDLIRITDCFSFAMGTGFLFDDSLPDCVVTGGTWGVLNGCSTDYCGRSVVIRGDHTVSMSGCTFWTHAESLLVEEGRSNVRVSGTELKSNGAPVVRADGGDHLVISGSSLLRTMKSFDCPAVTASRGNLVLSGNRIASASDGVCVRGESATAVLTGNSFDIPDDRNAVFGDSNALSRAVICGNGPAAVLSPPIQDTEVRPTPATSQSPTPGRSRPERKP